MLLTIFQLTNRKSASEIAVHTASSTNSPFHRAKLVVVREYVVDMDLERQTKIRYARTLSSAICGVRDLLPYVCISSFSSAIWNAPQLSDTITFRNWKDLGLSRILQIWMLNVIHVYSSNPNLFRGQ